MLFVGSLLILQLATPLANALQQSDSGSIDLGGTVYAPPPPSGAVITSPTSGRHFTDAHITVAGTCPLTTTVEIYKNDIFAGSTTCDGGYFSLEIDIIQGETRLKARVHDALNQYGPDSPIVIVFYDAHPSTTIAPTQQLLLVTESLYQGQSKGRPLSLDVTIIGGQSPYALTVDWGDGNQDLFARPTGERFTLKHTYSSPGVYKLVIKATDSLGNTAYVQVVGVVNGPIYKDAGTTKSQKNKLEFFVNYILPILILIIILILTFWLGEKWEFHEIEQGYVDIHAKQT